jgi:sugar/nucleoside kinase (ribokinase family)
MEIIMDKGVSQRVIVHCPEVGFCLNKAGEFTMVPSIKLPKGYIKGSVGAGDAFCAGTLVGIYKGWTDRAILEFASGCAVMALGKADATSGLVTESEVREFCKQFERKGGTQ